MSRDKGQPSVVDGQPLAVGRRRSVFRCVLLAAYCLLLVAGCRQDMQDQPRYEAYEPSKFFKDGLSSRTPVEGTVPRGYLREDAHLYTGKRSAGGQNQSGRSAGTGGSAGTPAAASSSSSAGNAAGSTASTGAQSSGGGAAMFPDDVDTFPFPVTKEVVERGRERYEIFCAMCHGATGAGDGMIVRRGYKKPPSYFTEDLRGAPVGHYFDVITNGWGSMPRYSQQIPAQDRWAIIAYIRALQLSHPTVEPDKSTEAQPQAQGGGTR